MDALKLVASGTKFKKFQECWSRSTALLLILIFKSCSKIKKKKTLSDFIIKVDKCFKILIILTLYVERWARIRKIKVQGDTFPTCGSPDRKCVRWPFQALSWAPRWTAVMASVLCCREATSSWSPNLLSLIPPSFLLPLTGKTQLSGHL